VIQIWNVAHELPATGKSRPHYITIQRAAMGLRHATGNERVSVSRKPGLGRRLAGDGIPSPTGANRAEARCWEARFSELDVAAPEFIPGRATWAQPEVCVTFAVQVISRFAFSLTR